jgi:hypothetical protein
VAAVRAESRTTRVESPAGVARPCPERQLPGKTPDRSALPEEVRHIHGRREIAALRDPPSLRGSAAFVVSI